MPAMGGLPATLDETLGEFLRRLRQARGGTQQAIAQTAQITRRTLLAWETGQTLPRLPELEATLTALQATEEQRQQALTLLVSPRGHRALRKAAVSTETLGLPIGSGDLLRAIRLRRQWVLEQAARAAGIAHTTLSRWEQGVVVPPAECLSRLLTLLEAQPEERVALTEGRLWLSASPQGMTPDTALAALEMRCDAFQKILYAHTQDHLLDLGFSVLEAEAWRLAHLHPDGQRLLALLFARHADYLLVFRRFGEARHFAERALHLSSKRERPEDFAVRAGVVAAHATVYQGVPRTKRPAPLRGLEILHRYAPYAKAPEFAAWVAANEAEYLSLMGRGSEAVSRLLNACRIAMQASSPVEKWLRQRDLAQLLLRLGRAEEALPLIHVWDGASPTNRVQAALLRAEGFLALKQGDMAAEELTRADALIKRHDLRHLKHQAEALSSELH